MKRFFAYGCSFVNYQYPTWADILIEDLEHKGVDGYNCGRSGSGNVLIASRIWETHARYNFNSDDIIIISWTNFFREDRYHTEGGWHTPGSIYHTRNSYPFTLFNFRYTSEKDTHDIMHYLLRDCMLMTSTVEALRATGAKVYTTHMNNPYRDEVLTNMGMETELLHMYKPWVEGSFESITNYHRDNGVSIDTSRPRYRNEMEPTKDIIEDHPLPLEHLDYLENIIVPHLDIELNDDTRKFANHWQNRLYENDQGFYPLEDWHTKEVEWPFG